MLCICVIMLHCVFEFYRPPVGCEIECSNYLQIFQLTWNLWHSAKYIFVRFYQYKCIWFLLPLKFNWVDLNGICFNKIIKGCICEPILLQPAYLYHKHFWFFVHVLSLIIQSVQTFVLHLFYATSFKVTQNIKCNCNVAMLNQR